MKFNRCLLLSLLLFVVLLPAFINAVYECKTYGQCYPFKKNIYTFLPVFLRHSKTCEDEVCVAFLCLDKDGRTMQGAGCYDDFVNACKWISPDVKLSVKGKNDFKDYGENYIVRSCDSASDCAVNGIDEMVKDVKINKTFGSKENRTTSVKNCEYNSTKKQEPSSTLKCETAGFCTNVYQIQSDIDAYTKSPRNKDYQQCDGGACTFFMCMDGAGQKYMIGGGCLNEFERVCTNVPEDAKKKIRENKNDYFYNDNTTIMVTCSDGDNCVDAAFDEYNRNNVPVYPKFDPSYNETCSYPSPPPVVTTTASSNGPNDFEFSGMLLFGLSLFQLLFW